MDEIELKFLDIDVEEIKSKLDKIGAKLIYDNNIESYSFLREDFSGSDSTKKYLRVRKINDKVEITYKDPEKKSSMSNREEIEIIVDDYEKACLLIEKLGFIRAPIFKKHRIHYELGNIHFEIDTLDNVPTYLEIETSNEQDMFDICKKLDLNIKEGKKGTIVEILPHLFNK